MPLSPSQTSLHWRRWAAVIATNHWRMAKGRMSPDAQLTRDASKYHYSVWRLAEELALQAHRTVTADDLRHGCYLLAATDLKNRFRKSTKVSTSSKDLDNATFSHLLCLWGEDESRGHKLRMYGVLIEPLCVESTMSWDDPGREERRYLVAWLDENAPAATVRAISMNAFGTREYETLAQTQLQWLQRTIRDQQKSWNRPRPASAYAPGPF
jgi:hypothetical protein